MECEKDALSYFDIFPNATLNITADDHNKMEEPINPKFIQDTVKSIYDLALPPKYLTLEHHALCKNVVVVFFEGLDTKRYEEYKNLLPNFVNISKNNFPINIQALEKDGFVIPGTLTTLGYQKPKRIKKKFKNIEEMILKPKELLNNGYPIHVGKMKIPKKPKCSIYNLSILSDKELEAYSELPEEKNPNTRDIISIDCEMVYTKKGGEAARLSVTDKSGNVVMDQLFKPTEEVIDYKTQFSGLTEEKLSNVTATPDEAVKYLSQVASKSTIIVGHSLENDFRALKLIHLKCVDTSVIYPNDANPNKKPSLISIYKKYINKPFRNSNDNGHDSIEDASAAMELVKLATREAVSSVQEKPRTPDFLSEMLISHEKLCFIERKQKVEFEADFTIKVTENDQETYEKLIESIPENDLIFCHFEGMNNINFKNEPQQCEKYDLYLKGILENLLPNSMLIVYCPNGNFARIAPPPDTSMPPGIDVHRRDEFNEIRNGLCWIYCSETKHDI